MSNAKIGALRVDLGMNTAAFQDGISLAERKMAGLTKSLKKTGEKMQTMGKNLTLGLTVPLVAFGVTAAKAAAESRDAMAQVNAGLASMGPVAGKTSEELQKLGKDLQYMSTFDDDAILRDVTANMLTFGNISGKVFDRAQVAVVNMATKLKMDLKSATILVSKALNDPSGMINSLSRTGAVSKEWVDANKNVIDSLVKTGHRSKAQAIILGELEKQVNGAAKAARDAVPGSDAINKWADLSETIGETLLVAFERIEPYINRMLDAFNNLSPSTQKFVTIALALAAALGPVMFIMGGLVKFTAPFIAFVQVAYAAGAATGIAGAGFSTLAAGLGAMMASLAPLLIPIAALAAAGYLIYTNWDKIGPILSKIGAKFQEAVGPKITALVEKVSSALSDLWNGPLGEGIRGVIEIFGNFQSAYLSVLGEGLVRVISAAVDVISGGFSIIMESVKFVIALLTGDWAGAWKSWQAVGAAAINMFLNVLESLAPGAIASMRNMVTGIGTWISGKLTAIWDGAIKKIEQVKGYFFGLWDAVTRRSYIPDMVKDIGYHISRLQGLMVDPAQRYVKLTKDAFKSLESDVAGILSRLFPRQASIEQYKDDLAKLTTVFAAGKLNAESFGKAVAALDQELRDNIHGKIEPVDEVGGPIKALSPDELQKELVKSGFVIEEFANKSEMATVRIAESFKDMTTATIDSLQSLSNSIKSGGFLDIFGSLVNTFLQLGSTGLFGNKLQTQINAPVKLSGARAAGGPVSMGKSYLVGENGPEVFTAGRSGDITPNHALGGSNIQIVPSAYFDVVVDGRILSAAPSIVQAGANAGVAQMNRTQDRKF